MNFQKKHIAPGHGSQFFTIRTSQTENKIYKLVTTGQYKTRTIVGRPHLFRSRRFINESMFYTESMFLTLSENPRFWTQLNDACSVSMRDDILIMTKTKTIIRTRLESHWLWETLDGNNKTEDMILYQSKYPFQKQGWFWSKRRGYRERT